MELTLILHESISNRIRSIETDEMAYLDTHYYGGIKKYQWLASPLSLHGVIVKKDGTKVRVNIGENENDPVFVITDLLVHLAGKQMSQKASEVIEGDNLDLLIGSRPAHRSRGTQRRRKRSSKKQAFFVLWKKHTESEKKISYLQSLKSFRQEQARDCGIDRSMILSYGQDDRVCAFTSLFAMLDNPQISRTACCILVDKEEIGSVGATGMHSRFFENTIAELIA